jgi:hypothetical protein
MKRWQTIGLTAILALGVGYLVVRWLHLGLPHSSSAVADSDPETQDSTPFARPATISWNKVDASADGFRVDMPVDVKHIHIPAYTETGVTQQLDMIFANPDAETTFSVSWQDDPSVARSSQSPESILEMARDGAMARTQTSLVSESARNEKNFPGKIFEARNTGGGVMNCRLIYAGKRLYMMIAAFPSARARRDRDVNRFFNSFTLVGSNGASGPATGQPGNQENAMTYAPVGEAGKIKPRT